MIYRVVAVPSSPPCSCRCLATSGASRDRFAAVGAELFFARDWVAGLPGSWMMIARFSCLAWNLFLVSWCFLGFLSVFSVSFSPVWDFLPSAGLFLTPVWVVDDFICEMFAMVELWLRRVYEVLVFVLCKLDLLTGYLVIFSNNNRDPSVVI